MMVPDCLLPPENNTVRVDLRHHVGLSLGPAVDMTNWSADDHLERALCPTSLADTLGLQRREYWEELNPILKRWKSVNKSSCLDCQKFIQINMGRHIRLKHTTYMCFWRCPVVSCSLWFMAELNAKDHIEGIHKFKEGEGMSFYECLRRHGIEWFGSRKFFDQRKETNQAIWMDMALARRSGQELRNSYIITNSPEYAVVAASRHSASNISGGVFNGPGDAGRCFPRGHSSSGDTGESPPTASRGRSTGGLYTTACEITTGGARFVYRQLKFIGDD